MTQTPDKRHLRLVGGLEWHGPETRRFPEASEVPDIPKVAHLSVGTDQDDHLPGYIRKYHELHGDKNFRMYAVTVDDFRGASGENGARTFRLLARILVQGQEPEIGRKLTIEKDGKGTLAFFLPWLQHETTPPDSNPDSPLPITRFGGIDQFFAGIIQEVVGRKEAEIAATLAGFDSPPDNAA